VPSVQCSQGTPTRSPSECSVTPSRARHAAHDLMARHDRRLVRGSSPSQTCRSVWHTSAGAQTPAIRDLAGPGAAGGARRAPAPLVDGLGADAAASLSFTASVRRTAYTRGPGLAGPASCDRCGDTSLPSAGVSSSPSACRVGVLGSEGETWGSDLGPRPAPALEMGRRHRVGQRSARRSWRRLRHSRNRPPRHRRGYQRRWRPLHYPRLRTNPQDPLLSPVPPDSHDSPYD